MFLQEPSRPRAEGAPRPVRVRAAFLGAAMVFFVGWAGVLAVLLKRPEATAEVRPEPGAAARPLAAPPGALAPRPPSPPGRPARVQALVVEHDDMSAAGTTRHLLRATVPAGLTPEQLRRCLDRVLDDERMQHPQVDAVGIYLYEEKVYARFTGMATPLAAAVAHGTWAPGGDWQNPARSLSGLDNRMVYSLPGK